MTDEAPVTIEGYAFVYNISDLQNISRPEVERAVAERPVVPLRVGDKVIGEAHLTADSLGLHVTAQIKPANFVQRGVDEDIPYGDLVHDNVPEAIRKATAQFSISSLLDEVSIVPQPKGESHAHAPG